MQDITFVVVRSEQTQLITRNVDNVSIDNGFCFMFHSISTYPSAHFHNNFRF